VIISHTHKYIFIKSEKTAGTSVEAALSKHCGGEDMVTPLGDYWFNRDERGQWIHSAMNAEGFFQHDPAAEVKRKLDPRIWNEYLKFTIVRNPWDRVVSLFSWEARNRPELQPQRRLVHRLGVRFDGFTESIQQFREFVKTDWKTNDRFYLIDGEAFADLVIRYERLEQDLAEFCKRVGLPNVELPRLKAGMRKAGHHYSEYYDDDSREIVAVRHANDLRIFGYEFERG